MATVINNPTGETSSASGTGFLLGIVLLLVMGFLFFYYGLPALRGAASTSTDVNLGVPEQIDVNVNNPGNSQ